MAFSLRSSIYFGYLSVFRDNKVVPNVVLILNIVLSLLLVFWTNTAHERFWEGRKLWGAMVNTVRNLARGIWIVVEEREPGDCEDKAAALRLVVAFSVALKLHLRRDPVNPELVPLMTPLQYQMKISATTVVTFTRIGLCFMAISKLNILQQIRQRLNRTAIQNPRLARRLCQLIPAHCPFERNVQIFRQTFHIPSLCKLNPLYEKLMALRFRALSCLANDCGEDISEDCS